MRAGVYKILAQSIDLPKVHVVMYNVAIMNTCNNQSDFLKTDYSMLLTKAAFQM